MDKNQQDKLFWFLLAAGVLIFAVGVLRGLARYQNAVDRETLINPNGIEVPQNGARGTGATAPQGSMAAVMDLVGGG